MNPNDLPPQAQLMKFIVGKWISKPIYAAAEFGIADILAEGPKGIDELARITGTHAPSLYRVMRTLASVGIFAEKEDKRFELTPSAAFLQTGALRTVSLMLNSDWNEKAWSYFIHGVRTGETAFDKAHGMPISRWLEKEPEAAKVLHEANAIKAAGSHRAIIDVYDFSGIETLTDVGGGYGALMMEILKANPSMKGIVADLPPVVKTAEKMIAERGFEDRCKTVEYDFLRTEPSAQKGNIPAGSDAYLLSNILHDWPDDLCKTILENCARAMKPASTLLVVEMIIQQGNEPSIAKLLDMEMMVLSNGRERTREEFKYLFESAGFELSRVIPTKESIYIIEGKKKS
jgi:hypothetical protein